MSRSSTSISRLWQIRKTIKHYGLIDLLDEIELPKTPRIGSRILFSSRSKSKQKRGVRIRLALEELGPVFVKLGQALSTRPDLLPADIALELTKLQDQVPPFSSTEAIKIIRNAYGSEFDEIFASVEKKPLASASIAQVHAAVLKPTNAIKGHSLIRPLG